MMLPDISFNQRTLTWGLFIFGCIFYLLNLNFESSGDTIYYANIIDTFRFDQLTVHQGYYLLGLIFTSLTCWTLNLPTDQGLAVMSALFGAGSLMIAYMLLKTWLGSERDALLGALMLFMCHRFYENTTSAEVYIVQTFFIWSSYLLYENRKFYSAGLIIALALWVSPLTVAFGLWFPVAAYVRGYGIRSLFKMSITVSLIYLPFLFFFYEELLWGNRGIINEDSSRYLDLIEGGRNFIQYQFKHYSFLNLLLIPALFAIRKNRKLLWLSLAASLPNIYVISQLRSEDNVFILTLDVFFVYWFVIGWQTLREKSLGWVAAIALLAHVVVFLIAERPFLNNSNKTYNEEMKAIAQIVNDAEKPVIFMDWARRMAFIYYNRNKPLYPLEEGHWYNLSFDLGGLSLKNATASPDDFANHKSIFVLESWAPSNHGKLFLDKDSLQQRFENNSTRRELERFLDVKCHTVRTGMHILYKCD